MNYWKQNSGKLVLAAVLALSCMFGVIDPATAGMASGLMFVGDIEPANLKALEEAMKKAFDAMGEKVKVSQDTMQKAIEELKRGDDIHAKTADELKKSGEEGQKAQAEFKTALNTFAERVKEMEQKLDKRPGPSDKESTETAGELFVKSEAYSQMIKSKGWNSLPFEVSRKTTIANTYPLTNDQPLVERLRLPGIIGPGLRRFTVRDLIPNLPTSSNLIEFAQELLFTSNAGPQGGLTSPTVVGGEGELKPESALTFQLANAAVITIAHYIPASRQILSDAPLLQAYINTRLTYGLKLEEEDELLNGNGTSGKLNGLRNQQTAFTGGATNQQAIDTLLKAFTQVSLAYFEASGVVLHPIDWQNILLLKDTTGRYLFSDPHGANTPSIWGKPVVATQAMTQGQFLTGAFDMAAAIFDREDVTIRVAEQHADWFARNLIAILCEERLALAVYRPAALVGGGLSYAG